MSKLTTEQLRELRDNLQAFIKHVEEDEYTGEYKMHSLINCIYAITTGDNWSTDNLNKTLLPSLSYESASWCGLFKKVEDLFKGEMFEDKYGTSIITKEQWLKVANKRLKKLTKKLDKRLASEG